MSVSRETSSSVSRETGERLALFADLLLRWNSRINLVSRYDEPLLWERHIADSLQLLPLIAVGTEAGIDMGSGAGFPGLVLSIATGIPFALIESDLRKAAFLREAARLTAAPVTVHARRIEEATLPPARLVTARALAPLGTLLGLASPLLGADGYCLFLKGCSADREIEMTRRNWTMRIERHISETDRNGVVLRISEVVRV